MNIPTSPHRTDKFYDNTKIGAYKNCPRLYFLRHVMNWRGEGLAMPLAFGGSWHAGMDVVWRFGAQVQPRDLQQMAMAKFLEKWEEEGLPAQLDLDQTQAMSPRTPNIANEMYGHYIEQRASYLKGSEILAIEQPFAVPLPTAPNAWYVGRLDKVIRYEGQTVVIEHKTTAIYRKDGNFDGNWTMSWSSDSQVKGYEFGAGLYFPKLDGVWVDGALCHKSIHNAFKIVPVRHTIDIIAEWLNDTEQWVERLTRDTLLFEEHGHLTPGVFPKNENNCFGKYGNCPFLDVCRTTSDIFADQDPPFGYVVEKWEPFETLGLEKIIAKD